MSTLNDLLARRMWFVPGVAIWGLPGLTEIDFVAAERVGSTVSILHGAAVPGGGQQTIAYTELTDHRGNTLPATLSSPKVFLRPQGPNTAFVIGAESPTSFRVARNPDSPDPIQADLLVIEMGD